MKKDRASKTKGLLWVAIACAFGIFFAVGLSPLAHLVPWSLEKKLGEAVHMDLFVKECRYNSEADAQLQRLVKRLYPIEHDDSSFSIEVRVVDDPVVNAYATLGGKININSGLIKSAETPEELAGVLAHEIEHVRHRHILERVLVNLFTAEGMNLILGGGSSPAKWAKYFLNMDFTRAQETQADEGGLRRLQMAHVDNHGFKEFFARMGKEESTSVFLSDHPSNRDRMEMVDQFKNEDIRPILTQQEWDVIKNHCCER